MLSKKQLTFTQILKWRIFILCMAEQRTMLQKQHAYIMQLIRIIDSQIEENLAKFIFRAWDRTGSEFKLNLVAADCDLLELLHSRKIFYAQMKKIRNILSKNRPAKKIKPSHCVEHFAWSTFASLLCPARSIQASIQVFMSRLFYQLICNNGSLLLIASSSMQSRSTIFV